MQLVVGLLFFFFGDGYKGWQDLFRRCSTNSEPESVAREPLIKPAKRGSFSPQPSASTDGSEEIMTDSDSQPETEVGRSTDAFRKQMTEQELLQGPATQKIKITREKTPQ